jgi:ATP/maltotriose-dependent transcriptional regulator MalT
MYSRRSAPGRAASVTRTLISSIAGRGPAQPVDASVLWVLTDREREVLARVAAGMSNDETGLVRPGLS